MMISEFTTFVMHRSMMSKLQLCGCHDNLVCNGFATDGVNDLVVDEFDSTVGTDIDIKVGRMSDKMRSDFIRNTERVEFRMGFSRQRFLILNCRVPVTVDGRINS